MIEKEILGCFIKDNSLINETMLRVNHFSDESHKLLFQSMLKLSSEGKKIDKVMLLKDNYEYIQQMGGVGFINDIETNGITENFDSYEKALIDDYRHKESEQQVKQWLNGKGRDTNELIANLQRLDELGVTDLEDKDDLLNTMADLPYLEPKENGIMSGLSDLDSITGGFQNQGSYILGARPSMGKSATMLKFALEAMNNNAVPIIFSLEMSKDELVRRLIATIGKINLFVARNPHKLIDSKKQAWGKAIKELRKFDFEIDDKALQSIQYIRSSVRKMKRKYEGRQIIILIDYLTLIQSDGKYQSDHSKFTDISAQIKGIAKEYDCPVITLAQLSRGIEQRQDKRPMLSDLRESGSIEQDADAVLFLYRESYYNQEDDSNTLEINVAKHRNGPTGTVKVIYQKETGEMRDMSGY